MTVTPVVMPRLGLTMEEGRIIRWLKSVGDPVVKGEELFEVEIDKGAVVAEAPASGVVGQVLAQADQVVKVGEPIALIAGSVAEAVDARTPGAATAGPLAADEEARGRSPGERNQTEGIRAAPLARRRAAELGIDLGALVGTGAGGRITTEDVERAAASAPAAREPAAAPALRPLSRVRRAVADQVTRSQQTIPQFALRASVDARALMAARLQTPDLSPVDFVIRACALALRDQPEANAGYHGDIPQGPALLQYPRVNVGLLVATDHGLLASAIRDADRKSLSEIADARRAAVARARAGRLEPWEPQEVSLSVSNLGPFGIEEFTAMVLPPQAAILALGAISEQPVARNGGLFVAPVMRVVLSVDHRVLDGVAAAQLLRAIVRHVEAME